MKVILSRMPAFEGALIRFDSWWAGLSPRERILVGGLAALLAGLVLVFGVIKPIQSARAQAIADIRTYDTLNARIRAAATLGGAKPVRRAGSPAAIVAESAAGFALQPIPEPITGGVRVALADASYDAVLGWLADLSATSDLRVRRLSIQQGTAPGRVAATVDLAQ